MKYLLIIITSLFLIIAIGSVIQTGTDGTMVTASQGSDASYTTAPESTALLSSDKRIVFTLLPLGFGIRVMVLCPINRCVTTG
jgi:hypothetical protein